MRTSFLASSTSARGFPCTDKEVRTDIMLILKNYFMSDMSFSARPRWLSEGRYGSGNFIFFNLFFAKYKL